MSKKSNNETLDTILGLLILAALIIGPIWVWFNYDLAIYILKMIGWTLLLILLGGAIIYGTFNGDGSQGRSSSPSRSSSRPSDEEKRKTIVMAYQSGSDVCWETADGMTSATTGQLLSFTSSRVTYRREGSTSTHYFDTHIGSGSVG